MAQLSINGQSYFSDSPPDTPLLWVLREELGLTGTKYGCGIGACGSCTVHVDGRPMRSCLVKVGDVEETSIITIEGLDPADQHPVQQAWVEIQVPQCGYCQSGMILAAVALLQETPHPSDDDINRTITNICRCGTYQRIRKAIHRAAGT